MVVMEDMAEILTQDKLWTKTHDEPLSSCPNYICRIVTFMGTMCPTCGATGLLVRRPIMDKHGDVGIWIGKEATDVKITGMRYVSVDPKKEDT